MKKLITAVLFIAFVFSLHIPVSAADIFYQQLPSPVISECSFTDSEKPYVKLSFSSSLSDAELVRKTTYDAVLAFVGSEEKLMASQYSYLSYETKNFCQVSTDGEDWFTVKEISDPEATVSLSYHSDILKPLILAGKAVPQEAGENTFYIRIVTASANAVSENQKNIFVYSCSEKAAFSGADYSYIRFILPEDAKLSQESLIITAAPPENDIELYPSEGADKNRYIPSRNGYLFDGWSLDGTTRTGIIPKGNSAVTLTSHWEAMDYRINYVITTRFGYPLGRADNSANPTVYFTDTPVDIYPITSPVVGFNFEGWYLTDDFSGESVTTIPEGTTGDIVLYAKWISLEEIAAALRERQEAYIREKHFGDIDGDGKVTAGDARLVLRASVGLESFDAEILRRVDYNNSGMISANNARTTLRISVGLDSLYDILLENKMLDSIK